jgi:hypothetical protein
MISQDHNCHLQPLGSGIRQLVGGARVEEEEEEEEEEEAGLSCALFPLPISGAKPPAVAGF